MKIQTGEIRIGSWVRDIDGWTGTVINTGSYYGRELARVAGADCEYRSYWVDDLTHAPLPLDADRTSDIEKGDAVSDVQDSPSSSADDVTVDLSWDGTGNVPE